MMNTKHADDKIVFAVLAMLAITCLLIVASCKQQVKTYENYGENFEEKLRRPEYTAPSGPYTPEWESLVNHTSAPDWFRDAKFGIYAHWGVYSVPAFYNEWYPLFMYDTANVVYKHHVETHGSPLEFGYPDFVPMFTAKNFDAAAWAQLFKDAGARFAGPVAEHHDGFAMWRTEWTPWNAAEKGPKRDVVGELEKAVREQGLRFLTSFHHGRNELWEKNGKWEGFYSFVKKYFPALLENPERAIMYGNLPRNIFLQKWEGELKEVVNQYKPDLIWFDDDLSVAPDSLVARFLDFYFNKAAAEGRAVVVTCKSDQIPMNIGVKDYERGRADKMMELPWLTDDAIGDNSWGYVEGLKLKTSDYIIHELIDIVSKNGNLLLNISPRYDGSIPEEQQIILREIGQWLGENGEAIYGTRPWKVFGEGPTQLKKGGSFVEKVDYTAEDIRYTRKSDTVYAITLGWPGSGKRVTLRSFVETGIHASVDIKSVSLLGSADSIAWKWDKDGLVLTTPKEAPNKKAVVYRIITQREG